MDQASAWTTRAKEHIRKLERPDAAQRWRMLLPELVAAALRNDHDRVLQIAGISPQAAREYALEMALGRWGETSVTGNREAAAQSLRVASQIGNSLRLITGDSSVYAAVAEIDSVASQPTKLKNLAVGHKELRDGMIAYRLLQTGKAALHFEASRRALGRSGSPAELWALCGLARVWGYEGKYAQALKVYRATLPKAERQSFISLAGWIEWGWAWIDARQGRLTNALSRARSMEEFYRKAGEAENLGAARFSIGQTLFLLGEREGGWRYNHLALAAMENLPTSFRRHVLLTSIAEDAHEDGFPEASLLIQQEALRAAREAKDSIRLTEVHTTQAKLFSLLARSDEALKELMEAGIEVKGVPQDATGRKLRADLLWASGEVFLRRDPSRALDVLAQAIGEYRALNASAAVAYASLTRAQAYRALGRDREEEKDLRTALQILEEPAGQVQESDLRLSYIDTIEEAYDELIRFQWEKKQSVQGLQTLERSRNPRDAHKAKSVRLDLLPEDGVVVEYALLRDHLLTWVLDRHGCQLFERTIPTPVVSSLVGGLTTALERGSDEETARRISSELHDLLIPAPVSEVLEGHTLYFVPDKSLNGVPFAALWDRRSGRYLIEEHPIAIASSLWQLQRGADRPGLRFGGEIKSALLVGNPAFDRKLFQSLPDLPKAETEVAAAASTFDSVEILKPRQATKQRFLDEMDRFDALIFAGHSVVNLSHPSQSYLVLASNPESADAGLLLGKEIQARKCHHLRLVILSSCSSIGPKATRAGGLAGLARPFLEAGASSVVGTLWNVQDNEGPTVLPEFYRSVSHGRPPILALREMQISAIHQKNREARASWAWSSFEVVVGQPY